MNSNIILVSILSGKTIPFHSIVVFYSTHTTRVLLFNELYLMKLASINEWPYCVKLCEIINNMNRWRIYIVISLVYYSFRYTELGLYFYCKCLIKSWQLKINYLSSDLSKISDTMPILFIHKLNKLVTLHIFLTTNVEVGVCDFSK